MGLVNNVIPFCLIVWGQSRIAGGLAAILNATTPLFTVLVAHVLTHDEKMTPSRIAGVALGFAAVVVVVGPDALRGAGADVGPRSRSSAPRFHMRWPACGLPPISGPALKLEFGAG